MAVEDVSVPVPVNLFSPVLVVLPVVDVFSVVPILSVVPVLSVFDGLPAVSDLSVVDSLTVVSDLSVSGLSVVAALSVTWHTSWSARPTTVVDGLSSTDTLLIGTAKDVAAYAATATVNKSLFIIRMSVTTTNDEIRDGNTMTQK